MIFAAMLIVIELGRPFDVFLVGLHIPLVICSLAIFVVVLAGGLRGFSTPPGRIVVALVLWMFLISPFSIWRGGSADYLKTYISILVVLFLAIACGPQKLADVKRLMRVLGFSVSLSAVVLSSLSKRVAAPDLDYRSGGLGEFGNQGEFALLVGFAIPFWVFAASGIRNKLVRLPLMAGGALYLFMLMVLTGTRSAFIALIPALLFFLLRISMVQRLIMIVAGVVLFFGVIAAAPPRTLQRLATLGLEDDNNSTFDPSRNGEAIASAQERRELFKDALETMIRNPVLGVGPGNFSMYRYYSLAGNGRHKRWFPAHDTYIQIGAECGAVGLILYIVFTGSIFVTTRRVLARFSPGTEDRKLVNQMVLCLQVSLIFYAVMAAFQNCDHYPHLFVLAGFAAALYRVTYSTDRPFGSSVGQPIPPKSRPLPTGSGLLRR